MDNIKVIELAGDKKKRKLSKKQMYKDILSSSNKIKEIIQNRKKSKRFDYLNSFPLKKMTNL